MKMTFFSLTMNNFLKEKAQIGLCVIYLSRWTEKVVINRHKNVNEQSSTPGIKKFSSFGNYQLVVNHHRETWKFYIYIYFLVLLEWVLNYLLSVIATQKKKLDLFLQYLVLVLIISVLYQNYIPKRSQTLTRSSIVKVTIYRYKINKR